MNAIQIETLDLEGGRGVESESEMAELRQSVAALYRAAYTVEAELIGASRFPPRETRSRDLVGRGSRFAGVVSRGQPVAVIELESNSSGTLIAALVVDPGFFRRGLGRALVEHAQSTEPDPILVSTAERNTPALKLYESMGFERLTRRRKIENIDLVSLIYRKREPDES